MYYIIGTIRICVYIIQLEILELNYIFNLMS